MNYNIIMYTFYKWICNKCVSSCLCTIHVCYLRLYVSIHVHSHVFKHMFQTYVHLQKMLLCLSHKSTLNCIDKLGEKYDAKVISWREKLEQELGAEQVSTKK